MDSEHAVLVSATVSTVTTARTAVESIEVSNVSGSGDIYYTYALRSATAATPVSLADDTFVLGAGTSRVHGIGAATHVGNVQVKLISAGTPTYGVTILP